MAKILKKITADAAVVIDETYASEEQAAEHNEPEKREVTVSELKIINTRWKKLND